MTCRRISSSHTSARFRVGHRAMIVVLGCLLLFGCSRRGYELAPVSGRVTLDGRPLADVMVSFQPRQADNSSPGPGSFGQTDAEGRYTLRTIEPDAEGAVVGTHIVRLKSKPPPEDRRDDRGPVGFKEVVPRQWRDVGQTFDVPAEGTDQADFHLKSR